MNPQEDDMFLAETTDFMKKENLLAVIKNKERSRKLITESLSNWANNPDSDTIKIKGVTLNLVFGRFGILDDFIHNIINPHAKTMQVLLLNPYSLNAIIRSNQESRLSESNTTDSIGLICNHSLERHKQCVLYEDFRHTFRHLKFLNENSTLYNFNIECKIYNTTSPSFLLIHHDRAIIENLIMGKPMMKQQNKLSGILPHMVYGKGEIKDSLESHFDYLWESDSVPLEDFNERVEEKYYEINRLFLLYPLQKAIWEKQWDINRPARSPGSTFDKLYQGYKEYFPGHIPERILDLGCGDGGGGSLEILKEHPKAQIDFIDISENAIKLFERNINAITAAQYQAPTFSSQEKTPTSDKYANEVSISYGWEADSECIVDELEQAFSDHGIRIVRDKRELNFRDSIKAFEQRIGRGQCIILVVSDKYLRSAHCMYELIEAHKNRNLRDRIFPIVLADALIYKSIDRLDYIKYWDEQVEQLNQAIKGVGIITDLSGFTAELEKYRDIRTNFDHLTDLLSDMRALTPEKHKANGFFTLINSIKQVMLENKNLLTSPSQIATLSKFPNISLRASDMLTFINKCNDFQYSLIHANYSIIYMTKLKATEIYRKIFEILDNGGIFMLSLWTPHYFDMPIGQHGEKGFRPNHTFTRVPMTEDLRIMTAGSTQRVGEIRRFYKDHEELLEEFRNADEYKVMDIENIHYKYDVNKAVLRVWIQKK